MSYEQSGVGDWKHLGTGGEASAYTNTLDLGTLIGGSLHHNGGIQVVYRVSGDSGHSLLPNLKAVYEVSGDAEHSFLRNLAAAILDAAFVNGRKYTHRHIPSPIGLSDLAGLPPDGYIYEYVAGSEGFPWEFDRQKITLGEWFQFSSAFVATGIPITHDTADTDDGRISKNIIMQSYTIDDLIKVTLPSNWGRIDFGFSSCPVSWEKFGAYLTNHKEELKLLLGSMGDVLLLAYNAGRGQLTPKEVIERYHKELQIFPAKFFNCL